MELFTTEFHPDLPGITALTRSVLPGLDQCAIQANGLEQANLLLFSGGVAAVVGDHTHPDANDAVATALGRVVANHTLRNSEYSPDLIQQLVAESDKATESFGWPDLPEVSGTISRTVGSTMRCVFQCRHQSAVMLLYCDPVMPTSLTILAGGAPQPALALAIGRFLLLHRRSMQPNLENSHRQKAGS
jgi:hypothetical protein